MLACLITNTLEAVSFSATPMARFDLLSLDSPWQLVAACQSVATPDLYVRLSQNSYQRKFDDRFQ